MAQQSFWDSMFNKPAEPGSWDAQRAAKAAMALAPITYNDAVSPTTITPYAADLSGPTMPEEVPPNFDGVMLADLEKFRAQAPAVDPLLAGRTSNAGIQRVGGAKGVEPTNQGGGPHTPADEAIDKLLEMARRTPDRSGQRGDLDAKMKAAMGAADAEKELSGDEQIAMALLATLPGLVGAIGGGAIAGGYGAAAGAAGGLKGGADGAMMINDAKQGRRKEAKGDAEKLRQELSALDALGVTDTQRAQDKELQLLTGERSKNIEDRRFGEKVAIEDRRIKEDQAFKLRMQREHDAQVAAAAAAHKTAAAGAGGAKMPKFDGPTQSFYIAIQDGMRAANDALAAIDAGGADVTAALMSQKAHTALKEAAGRLAFALAKSGDPGSAVLEGELRRTRDEFLSDPSLTRTKVLVDQIRLAQTKLANVAIDKAQITQGFPIPGEVNAYAGSGQPQGGAAPLVKGPETLAALVAHARAHPEDPDSAEILATYGQ